MRALVMLAAAAALAGCATPKVSLYSDADGTTGAVGVMDPGSQAERGALTQPNTWTKIGGKQVKARPITRPHTELMSYMPAAPQVFVLYFVEGSTTLTSASAPTLDALRKAIDANAFVQITGHTDTVGASESNDALSRQRALEIRDALVEQGLPLRNAKVTGRGERELRVKTADSVENAENRRVEVIVR